MHSSHITYHTHTAQLGSTDSRASRAAFRPHRVPHCRRHACVHVAAAAAGSDSARTWPIPRDAEETAQQARAAVQRAFEAGVTRQRVELLLPLIGATDLDDWPGGVRQQFKAVLPMVESMLAELKRTAGLEGRLNGEIWDQGDAVGAWLGAALNVVVFPTAETLKRVQQVASQHPDSLLLMVNPQWQQGQVVSDFGFFGRKKAEAFVAEFEDTYFLKVYTITGDSIRVLRSYPGDWQVHLVNEATGEADLVTTMPQKPTYKELQELIKNTEGSNSSKPWDVRLRREIQFNSDSLKGR